MNTEQQSSPLEAFVRWFVGHLLRLIGGFLQNVLVWIWLAALPIGIGLISKYTEDDFPEYVGYGYFGLYCAATVGLFYLVGKFSPKTPEDDRPFHKAMIQDASSFIAFLAVLFVLVAMVVIVWVSL